MSLYLPLPWCSFATLALPLMLTTFFSWIGQIQNFSGSESHAGETVFPVLSMASSVPPELNSGHLVLGFAPCSQLNASCAVCGLSARFADQHKVGVRCFQNRTELASAVQSGNANISGGFFLDQTPPLPRGTGPTSPRVLQYELILPFDSTASILNAFGLDSLFQNEVESLITQVLPFTRSLHSTVACSLLQWPHGRNCPVLQGSPAGTNCRNIISAKAARQYGELVWPGISAVSAAAPVQGPILSPSVASVILLLYSSAFLVLQTALIISPMVSEMDFGVQQALEIAGVSPWTMLFSWFEFGAKLQTLAAMSMLTGVFSFGVLQFSQALPVVLMFALLSLTTLLWSVCFGNLPFSPKRILQLSRTAMFLSVLPYCIFTLWRAGAVVMWLTCLLPGGALGCLMELFISLERSEDGLTGSSFFKPVVHGLSAAGWCTAVLTACLLYILAMHTLIKRKLAGSHMALGPRSACCPWMDRMHNSRQGFSQLGENDDSQVELTQTDNSDSLAIAPTATEQYSVVAKNMSKKYKRAKERGTRGTFCCAASQPKAFTAVFADLNMEIPCGKITVLLGENGAGKTTLLQLLTAQQKVDSGQVTVCGLDPGSKPSEVRHKVGLCPQHDTLLESLTVLEHCELWAGIKGRSLLAATSAIEANLRLVGLYHKRKALAKSLSGGQKRKLCIVLAVLGSPALLLLDEPTTGVDATSRREIWRLLRNFQGENPRSAVLLSTHHMDEAELLANHVLVLGRGGLQASGTPWELKKQFNIGYLLTAHIGCTVGGLKVEDSVATSAEISTYIDSVHNFVAELQVVSSELVETTDLLMTAPGEGSAQAETPSRHSVFKMVQVVLLLPIESQSEFGGLFDMLQVNQGKLGVEDYGLRLTSLESAVLQVFAEGCIASEAADDSNDTAQPHVVNVAPESTASGTQRIVTGPQLKLQQIRAVYKQRSLSESTNCMHWLLLVLAPLFNVLFVLALASIVTSKVRSALTFESSAATSLIAFWNTTDFLERRQQIVVSVRQDMMDTDASVNGNSLLTAELEEFAQTYLPQAAVFTNSTRNASASITAVASSYSFDAAHGMNPHFEVSVNGSAELLQVASLLDSGAIQASIPVDVGVVSSGPFNLQGKLSRTAHADGDSSIESRIGVGLRFVFLLLLVQMITSSFMRHSVMHSGHAASLRSSGIQDMVFSMGCQSPTYWLAQWVFDASTAACSCVLLGFLLVLAAVQGLLHQAHVLPVAVLALVFACSTPLMGYMVGLYFKDPALAQQWSMRVVVVQMQVSMLLAIFTIVGSVTASVAEAQGSDPSNNVIGWLKLVSFLCMCVFPGSAMLVGGLSLVVLEPFCLFVAAEPPGIALAPGGQCEVQTHLHAWATVGSPLLALVLGNCLWFMLLVLQDRRNRQGGGACISPTASDRTFQGEIIGDDSVRTENLAVEQLTSSSGLSTGVVLQKLRKVFHTGSFWNNSDITSSTTAVGLINLHLFPGEVFGLLGHNGAGKTSLISMLAGVSAPSGGKAFFFGRQATGTDSPAAEVEAARHLLGFCPQINALFPKLTGRQVLRFYAAIKGLPDSTVPQAVAAAAETVGVSQHIDKQCRELSGGNKRKLCLAVAYLGDPSVILLDEPSSGMDASAAQKMRALVRSRRKDRVTVVTTHVMSEADALSDRLGVMVRGQLVCLGTGQHLKARYGAGYTVEMQLEVADAPVSETVADAAAPVEPLHGDSPGSLPLLPSHVAILNTLRHVAPDAEVVGTPSATHMRVQMWHSVQDLQNSPGAATEDAIQAVLRNTVGTVCLGTLFHTLHSAQNSLLIKSFSVGQTDLEAVFLYFSPLQQRLDEVEAEQMVSTRNAAADMSRVHA